MDCTSTLFKVIDYMKANQVDYVEFEGIKVNITRHNAPVNTTANSKYEKSPSELIAELDESLLFHSVL
jgi:hypothetical protein